jgi:putative spermidine/putrescine transport system permease protein
VIGSQARPLPIAARRPRTVAWSSVFLYGAAGLVLFFLLIPILIIIPMSFGSALSLEFPPRSLSLQWYQKYFTSPAWLGATWTSFQVAIGTTVLATPLGTLAAFGLVRGHFRGKDLVYSLVISPIIVPGVVIAVAVYIAFARLGLVGTPLAMILAHTVLAIPLVVVNVSATLKGFDETLERAAMSLGAGPLTTFLRVTFPIIRPGVIAGALFAFMTSFDEVIVAIFLAGRTATTLPKRMWDSVLLETDPTISAISTLLIGLTLLVLVASAVLRRRDPAGHRVGGE